ELERKVTVYEKGPWQRAESYGEWQTRSGDITIPKIPTDEPLRLECEHFLALVRGEGDRQTVARAGALVVRPLERLTGSRGRRGDRGGHGARRGRRRPRRSHRREATGAFTPLDCVA